MHCQPRPNRETLKLKRQNDELAFKLLRAKEALQTAERHRVGLEVMLDARLERIDKLTAQVDQLREQNRKLDQEAERLAEMIRFAPPVDAAMLAPK
jgi:septal ring factor EnvC (AmiA/AmiB activator)